MLALYNTFQKSKLKSLVLKKNENRITVSFYKYFYIHDPYQCRDIIYQEFFKLNIFGRIYVAKEGINAQISILKKKMCFLKHILYIIHNDLKNVHINKALNKEISFWFLQVKVRKKIVADGLPDLCFDHKNIGKYIEIKDVNTMLNDIKTIFIDMRNDYEYKIGHFENAIHIPGSTFRIQLSNIIDFLIKYKNKNLVLYCTGGIRCEKATIWLKYHNFHNVYHIKGGILNYINESRKNNFLIKFQGKNFVFDYRISEKISEHVLSKCENCGYSSDIYINCKRDKCHRLFIQCKFCQLKYDKHCSRSCKKHNVLV